MRARAPLRSTALFSRTQSFSQSSSSSSFSQSSFPIPSFSIPFFHGPPLPLTSVLAALVDGMSAEEIADAHFVALTTVRTQIRAVLQKLGVRSQLADVAAANRVGWKLDDDELAAA